MTSQTHPLLHAVNDSPTWRVARDGTILLTQVGSTVHGVNVEGQDDRDELGICVEPADHVLGLSQFEQYEYRTQPVGARSGPGDLDLTVYGLRKWLRLALQGNPSVLVPLFVPITDVVFADSWGVELRRRSDLVASRRAGYRFRGYMESQRLKLLNDRNVGVKRPELVARYGFDTKFAYHMVRLGLQGVEYLNTGRFTLPMREPDRTWLRELRVGEHTQAEALERCADLGDQLTRLLDTSPLPPTPDVDAVNAFLGELYPAYWSQQRSAEKDR